MDGEGFPTGSRLANRMAFLHRANLQKGRARLFDPVNVLNNRAACHFVTPSIYLYV
jgi:hypothetical protein